MTRWWPILIAVFVPGGSLLAVAVWLRRRWLAREVAAIDRQLADKRAALASRRTGQTLDESLQASAGQRRAAVDHKKRQAAQIASGQPAEDRIRLVR